MKYLSICSGIEAATVAWEPLGWEAVGFSEIEAFPRAVLQHHYPDVPLHGDFTQLIENPPSCDVLVGGTPCQAFSVAGSRRSLDDARGNLSLAYVMLADAIDRRNREEGKAPVIAVWENVPGVFSTSDNAFGFFLRGLAGSLPGEDGPLEPPGGKWTHCGVVLGPQRAIAWRVLDAQYFGLAQRRQRVFVVASARDGFDPSQVLLEWEGVRRDSAPSREARKEAPAPLGGRAAGRDGGGSVGNFRTRNVVPHVVASTSVVSALTASGRGVERPGESRGQDPLVVHVEPQGFEVDGAEAVDEPAYCYPDADELGYAPFDEDADEGAERDPVTFATVATTWAFGSNAGVDGEKTNSKHATGGAVGLNISEECAYNLRSGRTQSIASVVAPEPAPAPFAFEPRYYMRDNKTGGAPSSTVTLTRDSKLGDSTPHVLAPAPTLPIAFQPGNLVRSAGSRPSTTVFPTLKSDHGRGLSDQQPHVFAPAPTLAARMVVRRLTPRECERLQGFPDDYTSIPWKNKPAVDCPDGPRYKALGNSMAVPCMAWIGRRIVRHLSESAG